MKKDLLLKLLPAIGEGRKQLSALALHANLGQTILKEIILELSHQKIGELKDSHVSFTSSDKLKAALLAISLGCLGSEVSRFLHWKDFEDLVTEILRRNDYEVDTNVHLKRPRMQIDVIGIQRNFALCIDCKLWYSLAGTERIAEVALRQLTRTRRLMESSHATKLRISRSMPVVVTLQQESVLLPRGVPIVPIDKFQNFIFNLPDYIPLTSMVERTTSSK